MGDSTAHKLFEYEEEEKNKEKEYKENFTYGEKYSWIAKYPKDGTVLPDILEFFHSYSYDCRKYFNLCIADSNTIIFASGNLIHFFDVATRKVRFKKGSMGGGIGYISKNPVFGHIGVGENGTDPLITIYEWPSMRIVTVLSGGTTRRYFSLAHSPDGLLLVSQGGEPDYFITVWNWQESKVLLRCKSYVQDVYNVTFSKYIPGHLTSSGLGHIKFWKMAKTFTGLKLKGETGRFGKTEISNIIAIYPMPNETVISGCEWGNILLWEEGLIKLEICRKNNQTAHTKYITRFEYINGELVSVGTDGRIRFWFYETIDHSDLPDGQRSLEIQPIYEFYITEEKGEHPKEAAMLMCIQKQDLDDPESTIWYAQDGNGGLWLLDLCTSKKAEPHQKIFESHAGAIVDMDIAEWGPYVATLDESGHLHVYNYLEKKLIVVHKFYDTGGQVVWLPCKLDKTGSTLICGFISGVVRMITVAVQAANAENNLKRDFVRLIQVLKPHTMPITSMSINSSSNLLITGSEDSTVFAFNIQSTEDYPKIVPIGYVNVPSPVSCTTWNPWKEATLLIGCLRGDCVEVQLPSVPQASY